MADAIQSLDETAPGASNPWTDFSRAALRVEEAAAREDSPEAYTLELAADSILIRAAHPAAAFFALMTLRQIFRQCSGSLPEGRIEDAPSFPARGVMLDISRDRVPTMETLFALVDLFSELKFNRLELYTEHTFAYARHPEVWAQASPMTPDEIRALDARCAARFIELVPNQNSFGHVERWLKYPRYRPLAEAPDGWMAPWASTLRDPMTLNPGDPGSLALVAELYDELLPNFRSKKLNVGGDETWELGQGRSRERCASAGKGRVYLDYLLGLHRLCSERGKEMHYWGDMVLHYPELISELPRDAVAMEWGYEADHPFEKECALFAASGLRFFVCPGTSSWNSLSGRTDHALANTRRAAEAGVRHGAVGYLVTDWGDHGHSQPLPVSYLPWSAAAEHAWRGKDGATDAAIEGGCSRHVMRDPSGTLARIAARLGLAHVPLRKNIHNCTALFRMLDAEPSLDLLMEGISPESLVQISDDVRKIRGELAVFAASPASHPETRRIGEAFDFVACGLLLACRRGRLKLGDSDADHAAQLVDDIRQWTVEYRRLWRQQSRPGGLDDSLAHITALCDKIRTSG